MKSRPAALRHPAGGMTSNGHDRTAGQHGNEPTRRAHHLTVSLMHGKQQLRLRSAIWQDGLRMSDLDHCPYCGASLTGSECWKCKAEFVYDAGLTSSSNESEPSDPTVVASAAICR
jgi:hypothetical protein